MKTICLPVCVFALVSFALLSGAAFAKKAAAGMGRPAAGQAQGRGCRVRAPGCRLHHLQQDHHRSHPGGIRQGMGQENPRVQPEARLPSSSRKSRPRSRKLAEETFAEVFSKDGGMQVVTAPGPDVLRFSSAIVDLWPQRRRHAGAGPQLHIHDQRRQRGAVRRTARLGDRPAHRPRGGRPRGAQFGHHALDQFRREHRRGTHDGVRLGAHPAQALRGGEQAAASPAQ